MLKGENVSTDRSSMQASGKDSSGLLAGAIRIEKIKVEDIYHFASEVLRNLGEKDTIPIAKHRALAWNSNPHAHADDIVLLVAYVGNTIAGYLGLLPGLLKVHDRFSKVYWISTWYVAPEFRKKSVTLYLIVQALSLKYDLVMSGMSASAEKVARGFGFQELGPLNYYVMAMDRLNLIGIFINRFQGFFKKAGLNEGFIEKVHKAGRYCFQPAKKTLYQILWTSQEKYFQEISYKETTEILPEDRGPQKFPITFHRDTEIINWMMTYKWILESDDISLENENYYFSDIRALFRYFAVKIYSSGGQEYKGFAVVSISSKEQKNVLKLLDFNFVNDKDKKYIFPFLIKYGRDFLAETIVFPESLLPYCPQGILTQLIMQRRKRFYLAKPSSKTSPLSIAGKDISLNYCDGDIAFI